MNAGATAERVYDALKSRIMTHEFRPGDRLDPGILAASLAASVTPVRDALHRLTGEGIVETRSAGGFHIPALDEPALKDLYNWSSELLTLAIRTWPRGEAVPTAVSPSGRGDTARHAGLVFLGIARRSANSEHARAVGRLNARLHPVRCIEPRVLADTEAELEGLVEAFQSAINDGRRDRLIRVCTAYHNRRRRGAAQIVRARYRID